MKKAELFDIFTKMFPDMAKEVVKVKLIGSKAISMSMNSDKSLIFMWYDDNNWTLGTKVWRRKPEHTPKKKEKKKDNFEGMMNPPVEQEA